MGPSASRPNPRPPDDEEEHNSIALYNRALQAYTLRLWTESLKAVEEKRIEEEEESCPALVAAAELRTPKQRCSCLRSA
ncbi:hypothetical protein R3P38DRAFT_2820194 [Favolaschia claudopus]|uniref:Uncharacterized protein n=1 Tax=Favolaschia claudopus TaxID=2862362 RepID=A0AAW0EE25_9AGAR